MADPRPDRSLWFGWWYISIGVGFGLLALRSYVVGGRAGGTALRAVIAVGFVILGMTTLRTRR
jgi:hypothetical protein